NDTRTCFHGEANFDARVPGQLHVLLPFGIAGEIRFAIAGITAGRGPAVRRTSDGEALQEFAIEADIEFLRPTHTFEVVLILALEANFDEILAVDRKVVTDGDAAAGAEGQVFVLTIVLQLMQGNLKTVEAGVNRRKACGEPRDLSGHRH